MLIRSAVFIKSASKLEECPSSKDWNPQGDLPEFAMIGRSNVGKSSLINTIANHSKLSKVSVTPGKTKLISHFLMNDSRYLVDLPGYGYASTGQKNRDLWIKITHDYFIWRETLKRVFVLVDGNILPQKIDLEFIHSLDQKNIPFDIVMTKIDKATQKSLSLHTRLLKEELTKVTTHMPKIFPISNVSKRGKEQLLEYIEGLI